MLKTRVVGWSRLLAAAGLCFGSAGVASAGDLCSAPTPLSVGVTNGTTIGTTSDWAFSSCSGADPFDFFYTFTAASTSQHTFTVVRTAATWDPTLSAYTACNPATEIACSDDPFSSAAPETIQLNMTMGETVLIRIAGWSNSRGPFTITVADAPPPIPDNDECDDAEVITLSMGSATVTGTVIGATQGALPNPIISCGFGGASYDPDVWYVFTAPEASIYRFDTEGSTALPGGSADTALQLFATDCFDMFVELACDDDGGSGLLSNIEIAMAMGDTVHIRVSTFPGDEGAFRLNVTDLGDGSAPANDNCLGTPAVAMLGANSGTNLFASQDGSVPTCATGAATINDVWWTFTPAATGIYQIDTFGSALSDTVLAVLDGCNGAQLACNDDSGAGLQSRVILELTMGTTYFIQVGGFGALTGNLVLNINPGSIDNSCNTSATVLTVDIPVSGSNSMSPGTSGIASCAFAGAAEFDAFFEFTAATAGWHRIVVSTDDPALDLVVQAATDCTFTDGASIDPTPLAGCADLFDPGITEVLAVQLAASQTIKIRVSGGANTQGDFEIVVNRPANPSNDICDDAIVITGDDSILVDALNAADDAGSIACGPGFVSRSGVWYEFQTTTPGGFFVIAPDFDNAIIPGNLPSTFLAAFDGGCEAPTEFGCVANAVTVLTLPPNSSAHVMIASNGDFPPIIGPYSYSVTFIPFSGACCTGGTCSIQSEADCIMGGGTYIGDFASCLPTPDFITEDVPVDIPDASGLGFPAEQTITVGAAEAVMISSIEVLVDIFHSWPGDLQVQITAPNMATAQLMTRPGRGADCDAVGVAAPSFGSANDIDGVFLFTDAATQNVHDLIVAGPAPIFGGTVRAQNCDNSVVSLDTVFGGLSSEGTWTVRVGDHFAGDVGTLFAIALNFNGSGVPVCDDEPLPCPGDYNDDGVVDLADLLDFLGDWNPNLGQSGMGLPGDINGDNVVDLADLLEFLGDWNPNLGSTCP
ncbi:MAG: hypothetical protein KF768_03820 [Phycisphaeraceae bacterium]|nr:hypothetical protein [Phycisphaeraceae bacterium]